MLSRKKAFPATRTLASFRVFSRRAPRLSGFLSLPTNNAAGAMQTYYLRSYAQYPGSDPTKPTVLGGISGAIGIQMGGTSRTTLLPSTGSGTAAANGSQGGHGFGTVLTRPAPTTKRSVS